MLQVPPLSKPIPTTDDLRCDRCGYLLRGLAPEGRRPECGRSIPETIDAQRARQEARPEGLRPQHFVLFVVLLLHALANIFVVTLAAEGVIHPPEAVLWQFTLTGPILGIVTVLVYQMCAGARRFRWFVAPIVCTALALAGYLSFLALCACWAAC